MSFGSSLLSHPHSVRFLFNNTGNSRFKAAAEVPDFLSEDWFKSRKKRPFGPRLDFSAEDAVHYQLEALKYNDQPRQDYGIEVMYRFAGFDPFERSTYFGPFFDLGQFERFRRIFHHSTYRVLLGHKERKIMSTLFVEEVECLFLFNFFFLYYLKKLMLYGVMSFKSNRTNTSSGFGFVEVDRRKRRYFNLQWFRGLVDAGMVTG